MPGLLDLPPELIEQIHFAHERLIEAEHKNNFGTAEELGRSRLTCRYFQGATRRSFVQKTFVIWIVKAPDIENIQRLCAMARTPDLAAAIRKLCLAFDDDFTMEIANASLPLEHPDTHDVGASLRVIKPKIETEHFTQVEEETSFTLPEVKATHTYDNITDALVPSAYLQHRVALVEAFRACKNVAELWIGNRLLEPERMHRYKRSSPRNRHEILPGADDEEQDSDGSEDGDDVASASDDTSEDGEESASDGDDSEGSDRGEREDQDHDGEDGDADDQGQASAADTEGHNINPDEGYEHHNVHIQDRRDVLFDITLSLSHPHSEGATS